MKNIGDRRYLMDIMLFIVSLIIALSVLLTATASFFFLVFIFMLIKERNQVKPTSKHTMMDMVTAQSRLARG